MRWKKLVTVATVLTASLSLSSLAAADLIFRNDLGGVSGSGLGTVSTVLTIQSPGATSTESGSVSFDGTSDVLSNTGVVAGGGTISTGVVQTGASQTLTRTLGEVGITSAGEVAIVLNASEPAGGAITLSGLELTIFQGGAEIFDAALPSGITFSETFTGTGNQGFVFTLNTAQAADFDAILAGLTAEQIAALRLGLSASATDATGGLETFNLSRVLADTPPPSVAEPGTLLLLGSGLAALGIWSKRRRR